VLHAGIVADGRAEFQRAGMGNMPDCVLFMA
jgi:hypothetical protein